MASLIDFAEMDLRSAFDFAIMIEEDAQLRYERLSRLMGDDPGGAGDVFRAMVVNEGRHRSQLVARRDALFPDATPRIQISIVEKGVERPDVDDDQLPRTGREALKVALAAERRAYAFFRNVSLRVKDPDVRAFFHELMQEEAEHGELLARKIVALEAGAAPSEDRAPPRRDVAPQPPGVYPDRALLQAVLARFDAATQAVVLGIVVNGMAQEDVAAALGVSRRTVTSKLARFLAIARQHTAAVTG